MGSNVHKATARRDSPTILDQIRTGMNSAGDIERCLHYSPEGIGCIETGGPEPAAGCAGRGISFALRMIGQTRLLERAGITLPIYDVIADVVCGGFSEPFRNGYASRIYLVTTAEMMSLYAVNNICHAVKNMQKRGSSVTVGGIIHNCRTIPEEKSIVSRFSRTTKLPIVGTIPFDPSLQKTSLLKDHNPAVEFTEAVAMLAENIQNEPDADFLPIAPEMAISVISEIIAGKKQEFANLRAEPVEIPCSLPSETAENHKIAIYGKGGVGKSTVTSNLSVALALRGEKVIQIGCDPKHDSVALLTGGMIPTVLDNMNYPSERRGTYIYRGFRDILCVESGGPEAGSGCAGQGVYSALEFLEKSDIFRKFGITTSIFDVLGDVVCGGFAQPLRGGFCREIYVVANGEARSLLVVNNILKACASMRREGIDVGVAGLIHNRRNYPGENDILAKFSEAVQVPVIAEIPRSERIQEAEMRRKTVMEYLPNDPVCEVFNKLAEKISSRPRVYAPKPLGDFHEILSLIGE